MAETAPALPEGFRSSDHRDFLSSQDEELTFKDLLLPVLTHPRLFSALLFAFSLPGVLFLLFAPRKYEVTALIRIGKVPASFSLDSIAHSTDPDQLVSSLSYILDSTRRVFPRVTSAKRVEAKPGTRTNLIKITVTGRDPVSAYDFLQKIVTEKILNPEKISFHQKMELIKKEIASTQKNLENAYQLRTLYESALKRSSPSSPSYLLHSYQLAQLHNQIFSMEQTLSQLQLFFLSPEIYPTDLVAPIPFPTIPSFPDPFITLALTFLVALVSAYLGCYLRDFSMKKGGRFARGRS